ncbi:hypothetical protein DYB26_000591 [Aphanomyces astaci]|uniref:FYVE-type domain-containing protein n=1 Tax=Aphanomyces astaci TaxID=112090 RepID=A0A397FCZ8_APHAT|nr:hypothetical protein DYB38_000362 [Aphanomyces astaci]RHY51212.1 hypothetical protein DYB34_004857 [Aphanomyces astaci]RHY85519.1 hypothetical protein DYB26_000591 [Aphanomyces astaci]RHZ27419.1 hypothetical protein DYB31_012862 [Aphanomyces astaci]
MFNPAGLDDPAAYREHCHAFHMEALDGVRLYCLESPPQGDTVGGQYVGVHWTVNELPGLIKNKDVCFVKNRDWCFLESHAPIVLGDGRRGWVRALSSVELHCCPDLKPSLGFVRANYHRSGYVFAESRDFPGYLDVTQLQQIDFRGTLTDLFASIEVAARKRDMRDVDHKLRAHRLSQVTFLAEHQLVTWQSRSKCHVCRTKFGLLLVHKHRCRKCGEVVCARCSKVWAIKVASIHSNVRVCSPCAVSLKYIAPSSSSSLASRGVLRRGTSTFAALTPRQSSDMDETASMTSRASEVSSVSGARLRTTPRTPHETHTPQAATPQATPRRRRRVVDTMPPVPTWPRSIGECSRGSRGDDVEEDDDGFSRYSDTTIGGGGGAKDGAVYVTSPPSSTMSHHHDMIKVDFSQWSEFSTVVA